MIVFSTDDGRTVALLVHVAAIQRVQQRFDIGGRRAWMHDTTKARADVAQMRPKQHTLRISTCCSARIRLLKYSQAIMPRVPSEKSHFATNMRRNCSIRRLDSYKSNQQCSSSCTLISGIYPRHPRHAALSSATNASGQCCSQLGLATCHPRTPTAAARPLGCRSLISKLRVHSELTTAPSWQKHAAMRHFTPCR